MKSDEARIAEAVASLRHRLDTWGVDDPHDKAHAYVNDMLRAGWRLRALPVETPAPVTAATRVPAEQGAAQVRAELTTALARLCSHGINRERATCRECDKPAPDQPTEPESAEEPT